MADAKTEIDLGDLHAAIVARIAAEFPAWQTVEAYRQDRKSLPVPACTIELAEMEAADDLDPMTGQLAMLTRWEARIVIGFRQAGNPALEIRKMAAALAAYVHGQRWGLPVGAANVQGAWPDDYAPELEQYECWRVEWTQVVHLGKSAFADDGVVPSVLHYSWAPDIGAAHEQDYERLEI